MHSLKKHQSEPSGPHLPDAASYYKNIMSRFQGIDELRAWKPSSRNDWVHFQTELKTLDNVLGFGTGPCHECAAPGRMQYFLDGHTLHYGYACKGHAHLTPPNTVPVAVARRRLYEAAHDSTIDLATLAKAVTPWFIRRPLRHEITSGLDHARPGSLILVAVQGKSWSKSELRPQITPKLAALGVTTLTGMPPDQLYLPSDVGRVWLEGVAKGLVGRYLNSSAEFDKHAPWTRER